MDRDQVVYLSYLLRLWSASSNDEPVWRASLESSLAQQRNSFASLDDLFEFLRQQTSVSTQKGAE